MTTVRDFNHTMLWPVQLRSMRRASDISTATSAGMEQYWEVLKKIQAHGNMLKTRC